MMLREEILEFIDDVQPSQDRLLRHFQSVESIDDVVYELSELVNSGDIELVNNFWIRK